MFKVTLFDSSLEIGTYDWDVKPTVGLVHDGFKILSVVAEPDSGEDFTAEIEYV